MEYKRSQFRISTHICGQSDGKRPNSSFLHSNIHSIHSSQSPVCVCVCVCKFHGCWRWLQYKSQNTYRARHVTSHYVTGNTKYVKPSPSAVSCCSATRHIADVTAAHSKTDTYIEGNDECKANVKLYPCASWRCVWGATVQLLLFWTWILKRGEWLIWQGHRICRWLREPQKLVWTFGWRDNILLQAFRYTDWATSAQ